jgi:hypothetical protein
MSAYMMVGLANLACRAHRRDQQEQQNRTATLFLPHDNTQTVFTRLPLFSNPIKLSLRQQLLHIISPRNDNAHDG